MIISCVDKIEKPHITIKDDIQYLVPGCNRLRELHCPEGNNLIFPIKCTHNIECKEGQCINNNCTETCEETYAAIVNQGRNLGLQCWTTITKCEDIEKICR